MISFLCLFEVLLRWRQELRPTRPRDPEGGNGDGKHWHSFIRQYRIFDRYHFWEMWHQGEENRTHGFDTSLQPLSQLLWSWSELVHLHSQTSLSPSRSGKGWNWYIWQGSRDYPWEDTDEETSSFQDINIHDIMHTWFSDSNKISHGAGSHLFTHQTAVNGTRDYVEQI